MDSEIGDGDVRCNEGIVGVHEPERGGDGTVDELERGGCVGKGGRGEGSLRATQYIQSTTGLQWNPS